MNAKRPEGCIFCTALQNPNDSETLIIHRGQHAFVLLNRYPYVNGHIMVAPMAHVASLELLPGETRQEIMELITCSMLTLSKVYHPAGYNIGANIGAAAGAGVVDHVHFHVVPRWNGDTNFMTTVGTIRVLPETLEETLQRVKEAW